MTDNEKITDNNVVVPTIENKTSAPDINVSQSLAFRVMVLFQVLAYGSYSVLVHLCERDGAIAFSSTMMNLILEFVKLLFSLVTHTLNSSNSWSASFIDGSCLRHSLPYSIPGLLYFINNNLAVHMQLQMDPASYQILSNFKIVTTAIIYRMIIKQKLSRKQWFAVCLLFFGGFFYSIGTIYGPAKAAQSNVARMYIRPLGIPMILVYCTISGLAGVYNEWILKKYYSESLHVQNIYLYTYGSLLNLIPTVGMPLFRSQPLDQLNLLEGFSIYTWVIIITQALNGLFMSVVIKHTSNIIRLFVISFSLVVTTLLSVVILHLKLNFYFPISFASMICALWLYYTN